MVSVADFRCLSHRWLGSPESQLHDFPLITPYPAHFTIVSLGPISTPCMLFHWLPFEFAIPAYCTSHVLAFWHLAFGLFFGIFGASCASYP